MKPSRVDPGSHSVQSLAAGAIIIAGLYFARDVLIPVALALLLTFLLAPAVIRLRRWGFGRIPAVMATVVVAFSLIGLTGWIAAGQILNLANSLPGYQQNISRKLTSLNTPGGGLVERTNRVFTELNKDLAGAAEDAGADTTRPVPVVLQDPPSSPIATLEAFVGPLLGPLATAGVVIVLVIFMLVGREDLRDRFIGLVGTTRMHVTTQALDDAGSRISRYLLMQFFVNVAYGVPVAVGLYFIGVPNAPLWGVSATLLRFVPYIGPLIAMALPLLLAFAADPGWNMLLMTGGLFLVLELLSNNIVEPWLYGASTGISSVAIMVAAIFWTWLWGPIGLLLSTPLTVCLAVMGRYVPQLSFLSVLLGNEPALAPQARLYQRMLAMDFEEASEVAGELLEKMPLIQVYDELVIPALSLAESDRHEGRLEEERKRFILDNTRELVTELAEVQRGRDAEQDAAAPVSRPRLSIVCLPAGDESDALAGLMLRELLGRQGGHVDVDLRAADVPIEEQVAHIRRAGPDFVVVSSVPPAAVRHAVHVCKRLKSDVPDVRVIVGLWSTEADVARLRTRLPESLAEGLFTRLADAVHWFDSMEQPAPVDGVTPPPVPQNEAARLDALRRTRLLDTPPEEAFDRVTRRLSEIFDAPMSLMSLIDENRQFWKAHHGLPAELAAAQAAARETSICGHVVAADETTVIEDTWQDPRFAGNPFLREHNIRFYAGAPLRTSTGEPIGSLCILDHRPRHITERDRQLLELMAETVMGQVEALALARGEAAREDTACIQDADLRRARAVQAMWAPPAQQTIGRTILSHRVSAGAGLASTFIVTRARKDGTIAILIGDAGGGDLSGALMTTAIAATAARLAEGEGTAGGMLTGIASALHCPDRGLPVSCTAAVLSPHEGLVEIATAGYGPPILMRDGTAVPVTVTIEPPLFTDGEWQYSRGTPVPLEPNDRLLFYTDRAVDVVDSTGSLLGVEGLAALAAAQPESDAGTFLANVDAALTSLAPPADGGWCLLDVDHRVAPVDTVVPGSTADAEKAAAR